MPEVIDVNKKKTLDTQIVYQNIILHLKCKASDIEAKNQNNGYDNKFQYNPDINEVQPFNENSNYCNIENITIDKAKVNESTIPCAANDVLFNENQASVSKTSEEKVKIESDSKVNESKGDPSKLSKDLNRIFILIQSPRNQIVFGAPYDFDNPVIYIPKCINDSYEVYGNFAVLNVLVLIYLNAIDDTTKFERYQMLNFMYCNIYDYKENIKLAPNPYYTLEKYMGNLTIQEYRKLLKNERLLILIDKPLTKIFS